MTSKRLLATDENTVRRLLTAIPNTERLNGAQDVDRGGVVRANQRSYVVKTPSGGIPARSGTTLGKADCTVQVLDKSTDVVSDGKTLSVYNVTDSAISGSIYVRAVQAKDGSYHAETASATADKPEHYNWTPWFGGIGEFDYTTSEDIHIIRISGSSGGAGPTVGGAPGTPFDEGVSVIEGLCEFVYPFSAWSGGYGLETILIDDNSSNTKSFKRIETPRIVSRVMVVDAIHFQQGNQGAWNNGYVVSEKDWKEKTITSLDDIVVDFTFTHAGKFYITSAFANSNAPKLVHMFSIQGVDTFASGTVNVMDPQYSGHSGDGLVSSTVTYFGTYDETQVSDTIKVDYSTSGSGPLNPLT